MTFEPRVEGGEGMNMLISKGTAFQAEGTANARAREPGVNSAC